jgi:cell division protein FtsN
MLSLFEMMMLGEAVVTHGTQGEVSTVTTGAISAIAGSIVSVLVMYFRTKAKVTVDGEVNVTGASAKPQPQVSWTEVRDLKDRVSHMERKLDEMKVSQGDQFQKLLTAAFEREHRLMEKIEKSITPVHNRIDDLMKLLAADKIDKK